MQTVKGIVADIQRSSIHDGPGIRTTVFLKGCPLNCSWCHNPECIKKEPEILFYPEKCIGCNMCDKGCFSGAKVICGKEMTSSEVLAEVMLDKAYYKNDGGVTFSGGEPMLQKEFVAHLSDLCHDEGINTAIETSMYIFDSGVLSKMDYIMCDVKIWDDEKHKKYTGVSGEKIRENIKKADKLGIPILIRTPIIPGINDTVDEIKNIKSFVMSLENAAGYELLPYHPLGEGKRAALGLSASEFNIPEKEKMEELKSYAHI